MVIFYLFVKFLSLTLCHLGLLGCPAVGTNEIYVSFMCPVDVLFFKCTVYFQGLYVKGLFLGKSYTGEIIIMLEDLSKPTHITS